VDGGFDPPRSVLAGVVVLGGSVLALWEGRGGYSADELSVATVDFGGWGDATVAPEARMALLDRSLTRLTALASVRAAAYAETLLDEQSGRGGVYDDDGRPVDFTERRVAPGFLRALGVNTEDRVRLASVPSFASERPGVGARICGADIRVSPGEPHGRSEPQGESKTTLRLLRAVRHAGRSRRGGGRARSGEPCR